MKPADKMRPLFNRAAVQANTAPDEAVFEKIQTAYTRTVERQSAQRKPSMWRFVMKSPSTRLAAAAVVLIACGIGLSLWRTTGSGIVLADVLAQVEKVKAFGCKGDFMIEGEPVPGKPYRLAIRGTVLASQDWGRKASREQVDPNGRAVPQGETYLVLQNRTSIEISHPAKRYTRTELDDAEFRRKQEGLVEDFDASWWLREIMKCKYESLGRSSLDGAEVEGFRTTDPNCSMAAQLTAPQVDVKLWVDVKTRMPVRVDAQASGSVGTGGRMSNHIVLYDIQWDVSVTATDFERPPVPDGYLVVVDKLPGPLSEEGAIQGLSQCVELLGKYPGNIRVAPPRGIQSELDASDSAAATRLKEELKGLTEQDRVDRLMEAGTSLRRVHRFFMGLNKDSKDPAYYGKTVTAKDADKVLLRWKLSDKEYRVIFGDLHAETVSAERLAELEKASLK